MIGLSPFCQAKEQFFVCWLEAEDVPEAKMTKEQEHCLEENDGGLQAAQREEDRKYRLLVAGEMDASRWSR
jgi:hypothetical protein